MMKKLRRLLTCVVTILTLIMAVSIGCGQSSKESSVEESASTESIVDESSNTESVGGESSITQFTVTFVVEGGTAPAAQTVNEGEKAIRPEDPVKVATSHTTEYTFIGWFTNDGETETEWNFFDNAVTENVTLYAKFTEKQVATPNYGKN